MNRLLGARATWLDVFSLWSTLSEQKWSTSRERRGSPIGFLLTVVPKCLVGESFDLYRKKQREHHEQEQAEQARQQEEMEKWQQEQQAILDDPSASEEEKRWARTSLALDVSVR